MRRLTFRVLIALLTFAIGITLANMAYSSLASLTSHSIPNLPDNRTAQTLPATKRTAPPSTLEPKRVEGLKVQSWSFSEATENFYRIGVEYPQIVSLSNATVRDFNRWIKNLILREVAEFRKLATADMREYQRRNQNAFIEESLDISYEVIFSSRDLISIRLTFSVMAPGQMHPIDYYESINYDLKSGRLLRLHELFKPGAKYLQAISDYCLDELRKRYEELGFLGRGVEPKSENFKNWNITPEGIFISFEDYQVGPHSMGQPELTVPYYVLKDLLANETPLALSNALTD